MVMVSVKKASSILPAIIFVQGYCIVVQHAINYSALQQRWPLTLLFLYNPVFRNSHDTDWKWFQDHEHQISTRHDSCNAI